jgi:hypothetical protein
LKRNLTGPMTLPSIFSIALVTSRMPTGFTIPQGVSTLSWLAAPSRLAAPPSSAI